MSPAAPGGATRLVLIRHGEAQGNREMRYLGSTDVPLTARGWTQAEQVARALARFHVEAIYSSPLARAMVTAQAIAQVAGHPVVVEAGLRETAYGDWEGLTRAEVASSAPDSLRQWEVDPEVAPPGAGESLRATQLRVVKCVGALSLRHPDATLALVSHVGPIKLLVCSALGLGPEGARRLWLDPASISVLDWPQSNDRPATVRVYNDTSHLAEGVRWLRRATDAGAR